MGAPGFDDAPIADVVLGKPKPIQLVYPYYENPGFLMRQMCAWQQFPGEVKAQLRVIVVDDGSPANPAERVVRATVRDYPLRLFRIGVDVRWNWLAARNIGMHHAEDGWCVLTDMDHVITVNTARRLIYGIHDPAVIYRFSRREADGTPIHPHPNSMFLTRAMFWRAGGYDEALSGFYGTDGDWRRRLAATAPVRTLPDQLERHEHSGDSSTIHYKRKQPEDAGKRVIIQARRRGWRPKVLSFPYAEVPLC